MTYKQLLQKIPNEIDCVKILENAIWNDKPKCPYCFSESYSILKEGKRYHCNTCNTSYSVTVKSVFHKTKIPLQVWFYIIHLKEMGRLDIPFRELGETLNVTKDTANRIVNKINNHYSISSELFKSINSKINSLSDNKTNI